MEPELITSKFGFVENAEIVNSRAAMVGIPPAMFLFFLFVPLFPPFLYQGVTTLGGISTLWGRTSGLWAYGILCQGKQTGVQKG